MTAADRRRLGAWLREQRRRRAFTSTEVATALGVDLSHICNIERGVGLPGLALFERWLRLFDVDLFAAIGVP